MIDNEDIPVVDDGSSSVQNEQKKNIDFASTISK